MTHSNRDLDDDLDGDLDDDLDGGDGRRRSKEKVDPFGDIKIFVPQEVSLAVSYIKCLD